MAEDGVSPGRSSISVAAEILAATVVILIIARILYQLKGISVIGQAVSTIVALLFLYVPIGISWLKKVPIDFVDRGFGQYMRSLGVFLIAAIIIFPLFFAVAHWWQLHVFDRSAFIVARFPHLLETIAFQLLLVAFPEEFFFRGYFQSAMKGIMKGRWRILGADLGWYWILTALIFAFAHTVVFYKWWQFSIFFPALLFGYLRERTGTVTAPALFHAASNVLMAWFASCYV